MVDVTYLPGVDPAKQEDMPSREPHEGVISMLETVLARAKSGDVRGIAVVELDAEGYATYSLVGSVGGYSMQGALHCVAAHVTDVNLGGSDG